MLLYCSLARDATRSLERIVALLPRCSSVCASETGVHCDHTVQVSADFSLCLGSPVFWAPWHQSISTYSQPVTRGKLFPVCCTRGERRVPFWKKTVRILRVPITYFWQQDYVDIMRYMWVIWLIGKTSLPLLHRYRLQSVAGRQR